MIVSIHAPTQGATVITISSITLRGGFNPRTHAGCDPVCSVRDNLSGCFNPRTHAGCDSTILHQDRYLLLFQSTHPRRVRLPPDSYYQCEEMFQSTHPRRVRLLPTITLASHVLFQSTHPRRVRLLEGFSSLLH